MKLNLVLVLSLLFVLSGCARSINADKLMTVSIDMDKKQIVKSLGNPSVVRGSIKNKYDQIIEVWEYRIDKGKTGRQLGKELVLTTCTLGLCSPILFSEGEINSYWLYFCNDKLIKWGQAGDWGRESDVIYEINFNASPKLH